MTNRKSLTEITDDLAPECLWVQEYTFTVNSSRSSLFDWIKVNFNYIFYTHYCLIKVNKIRNLTTFLLVVQMFVWLTKNVRFLKKYQMNNNTSFFEQRKKVSRLNFPIYQSLCFSEKKVFLMNWLYQNISFHDHAYPQTHDYGGGIPLQRLSKYVFIEQRKVKEKDDTFFYVAYKILSFSVNEFKIYNFEKVSFWKLRWICLLQNEFRSRY